MKKMVVSCLAAAGILLASPSAFSWGGKRPSHKDKVPCKTRSAQKTNTSNSDEIVVNVEFNNPNHEDMTCSFQGSVLAKHDFSRDYAEIFAYVVNRKVKATRGFNQRFYFDTSEAGDNYTLKKSTQQHEPVCNQGNQDDPQDRCDPEVEDCDWGCQADEGNGNECESGSADWPDKEDTMDDW